MTDIWSDQISTAGVFVQLDGRYPFQVGPTKAGTTLGVVRLGGHREPGERGWTCAAREALEEATLRVEPVRPPATYWYDSGPHPELTPGEWPDDECPPLLVGRHAGRKVLTPIYLGRSADVPVPAMETKGILLLRPDEIRRIAAGSLTLGRYLDDGGRAVLRVELPRELALEPFPQLQLLARLFDLHPELAQV